MAAKSRGGSRGLVGASVLTALALAFTGLSSGPARAQSLADTLVTAYRNSPEIEAARADVKIAAERAVQARSGGRLQVEANASLTARYDRFERVIYPGTVSLTFDQPLYTGGRVENATDAAEKRIEAAKLRLQTAEQQLFFDAIQAYSNVLTEQATVELRINNVKVLTEQLRAAKERFEVGEITRTDVEQARARRAAGISELAAARQNLAIAKADYQRVVGVASEKLLPPPPLPDVPGSLENSVVMALNDRPDVIEARVNRDAAGSDVRAQIAELLPELTVRANVFYNDILEQDRRFTSDNYAADIGLNLRVPIYQGGFAYSNVREAQANAEGASANITAAERNAVELTARAWAVLEASKAQINAGRLEVQANQLAFEGVEEEAKVGARTTLDVLDAEQELLDSRVKLVVARRDEFVAAYGMLFAVGKLTVEHLGLDVGEPDPVVSYYSTVRDRNFGYDRTDDTVWSLPWRP